MKLTRTGMAIIFIVAAVMMVPLAAGAQTITYVTWWAGADFEALEFTAREFEAANPGVNIEFEVWGYGEFLDKLAVSTTAGVAPDVIQIDQGWAANAILSGLIANLDEYIARDGVDLGQFVGVIQDRNGSVYALPLLFDQQVTAHNKNLFGDAGLDTPTNEWTYSDYVEAARFLTRDRDGNGETDQWGNAGIISSVTWAPWQWMNGDVIKDGRPTWQSPEMEEILNFFNGINRAYVSDFGGWTQRFFDGNVGVAHVCAGCVQYFIREGWMPFDYGVTTVPKQSADSPIFHSVWTNALSVSPGSDNVDLAWKVASYFVSEEAAASRVRNTGWGNPAVGGDALQAFAEQFPEVLYLYPGANALVVPWPVEPWYSAVAAKLSQLTSQLYLQQIHPHQFMEEMQAFHEAELAK